MNESIIYLDNAATSFPKPESVMSAMVYTMKNEGGNPGRGSHVLSLKASERVFGVREKIAKLFGGAAENVVFTKNCTESINLCINSLLKSGDHVLISDIEHNAVARPVFAATERGVSYSVYESYPFVDISRVEALIRKNTRAIIACHVSNILPVTLPIYELARLCKKHSLYLIVDCAQSAGVFDIDISRLGKCVLCAPGHKGLLGPSGTGFALFSSDFDAEEIQPFICGGSGSESARLTMPAVLPERLEAGTLNTVGIAGLGAGIDFLSGIGTNEILRHEKELSGYLCHMLGSLKNVCVYMPKRCVNGWVLFNVKDHSCEEVAELLNKNGICVRSGLHCAYLAHGLSRTQKSGAVRVSFGIFNTASDAEAVYRVIRGM